MALKSAVKTGGDFLDLRELTEGGPVVAIFRIREFEDPEKGDYGYILPTFADVFIVDGDQAGEVHQNEKFIGAITSALRGVRNPNAGKSEKPQAPVNERGDELIVRLTLKNAGKPNAFVVGDAPSSAEEKAAEKAYEAAGGDKLWEAADEREVVAAGASRGKSSRPWD